MVCKTTIPRFKSGWHLQIVLAAGAIALVTGAPGAAAEPAGAPGAARAAASPEAELHLRSARSAARRGDCATVRRLGARVRAIDPAYHADVFVADPDVAGCPAPVSSAPPATRAGATFEVGAGLGVMMSGEATTVRVGGVDLGVGWFATPHVAVGVRAAGATFVGEGGPLHIGVAGPHAQVWLDDRIWVGAGAGGGYLLACAGGCAVASAGLGLDARAGVTIGGGAAGAPTVSAELTTIPGEGLHTFSLLLGYQWF